jgi:hypothetical protein
MYQLWIFLMAADCIGPQPLFGFITKAAMAVTTRGLHSYTYQLNLKL